MPAPLPGRKVRGSETGRPIMALLDLIGRRWTLRIIWELWQAPAGFRALQARCDGMSPSVLSQRLSELEEGLLVAQDPATGEYALTDLGRDLGKLTGRMNAWADAWAKELGR